MSRWKSKPKIRDALVRAQGGRCHYCRRTLTASDSGLDTAATLDHRVPRSIGGGHGWDNAVAACEKCNGAKADRQESDFKGPPAPVRKAKHRPNPAEIMTANRKQRERKSLWQRAYG